MLQTIFTTSDDFPAPSIEQWRAVAEKSLRGQSWDETLIRHTDEGIDLQPLYPPTHTPPYTFSYGFSRITQGWDIRQVYEDPDPAAVNHAITKDLKAGINSIELHCNSSASSQDGIELERILAGVDVERVAIALDGKDSTHQMTHQLVELWQQRGAQPTSIFGAFNFDPLAAIARSGDVPQDMTKEWGELADLAKQTKEHWPNVTAIGVDTSPYHEAGAHDVQDLAFALATGIEYLRELVDRGLTIDEAAKQIHFRTGLDCRLFHAIAKQRAARALWSYVVDQSGGSEDAQRMSLQVGMSRRVLARRDPWVNILRNTTCCFAGAIGGADVITSMPHDRFEGVSSDLGRRLAVNTQHILREEAHLHRVIDPAGGSWFIETLTETFCRYAWKIIQEIESHGGMTAALTSGWVHDQINQVYQNRQEKIARRDQPILGVSEFPLHDELFDLAEIQTFSEGDESFTVLQPLYSRPDAEQFEQLRDASDRYFHQHGNRPHVFLANLGTPAQYTARSTFAENFFAVGGFEIIAGAGSLDPEQLTQEFSQSGAQIAVICSSDPVYQKHAETVARALRQADAGSIILAGHPKILTEITQVSGTTAISDPVGDAHAGVDECIYLGCNALQVLRELLVEEGVLS